MFTLLIMSIICCIGKATVDITIDTQMIILAICVASDLNILSQILKA